MKDYWKSGVVILLIIGSLYFIFLKECKDEKIPKGFSLIETYILDSIKNIVNLPPKVKIDTIFLKSDTIFFPKKELIFTKDTINNLKTYKDSIVNEDIKIWMNYIVSGSIFIPSYKYIPITKSIIQTKTQFYPKIIDRIIEKNEFYFYGITGAGKNDVMFGIGLDYINKKNYIMGLSYQRLGGYGYGCFKFGISLNRK